MDHAIWAQVEGDWLHFKLPLGDAEVHVKLARDAMVHHFGADDFPTLVEAYKHHAEQIHLRVAPLARQGETYGRDNPLVVRSDAL